MPPRRCFAASDHDDAALERRFAGAGFRARRRLDGDRRNASSPGITCFADRYYFPDETARAAVEQGMRAVIGLPVAETASLWAKFRREYFDPGLALRDEYEGHPLISTVFAPLPGPI